MALQVFIGCVAGAVKQFDHGTGVIDLPSDPSEICYLVLPNIFGIGDSVKDEAVLRTVIAEELDVISGRLALAA